MATIVLRGGGDSLDWKSVWVSCFLGVLFSCALGFLVSGFRGLLAIGFLLVYWFLDFLVSKLQRFKNI